MWMKKEKLRELLWEERQKAIMECKADLAWVFSWPPESSWQGMIEHVQVLDSLFKKENEDI